MHVLTQSSPRSAVDRLAGNKARSLHALAAHGLSVPSWAVIGADVFAAFLARAGLDARIAELLGDFEPVRAEEIAERIAGEVLGADPGPDLRACVREALTHIGEGPVAVRSSGLEEDGASFSFAGQFDSYLDVEGFEAVCLHVKKCWASAWSARSLLYRRQHGLDLSVAGMAVIVQRLVQAEKSGVVFTANPTNGSPDEMVISAVYGLGEGLVSGAVDADGLVLDKKTGEVRSAIVGEKGQRHDGRALVEVPVSQQQVLSIDPEETARLWACARKVEAAFGRPQDIEWCSTGSQLWVLQSRPITTPLTSPDGELRIWDNSNIVENFPGVTSQLTFTFAQHVYSSVFREFCRLLLIPEFHLRQMDGFLGSVLGHVNGRVYYNLLHWYKLSGTAPFQNLGRKMMELQMGVDEALDLQDFEEKIRPYSARNRLEHLYLRGASTAKFAWYFATLPRHVAGFRNFFYRAHERFDAIDYRALGSDQVYAHYREFETGVISRWGKMVALESAIGLSYGLLRGLTRKWVPDAPPWFEVAVIGNVEGMESMEPVRRLRDLADRARAVPAVEQLLRSVPAVDVDEALRASDHAEFVKALDQYLADFGDRSNNELKLEEPDLREAPHVLFEMLKATLANGPASDQAEAAPDSAEGLLSQHLGPVKRWVFERVRGRVRMAIRARETVRFCRSRAFGLVRRMFKAIGEDFVRLGVLKDPRDIFHLRLEELRGCFEGTLSHRELQPLVEQRKRDHAAYLQMAPLPPRFVTRGPVAAALKHPIKGQRTQASDAAGVLQGTACSPGVVEGRAKVVSEPHQFDGGVLVTYRTDPGWVPVFSAAKALLIERGSPLTHAAIVARELGVPTIVQIPGLTSRVESGMLLKVDGNAGTVAILDAAQTEGPAVRQAGAA